MGKRSELATRERRKALPQRHKPFWEETNRRGLHLGYHKGSKSARWRKREFIDGRYKETSLGLADDTEAADGRSVLSYEQAHTKVTGGDETELVRGSCTVREAAQDYFTWRQSHSRSAISVRIDMLKMGFLDDPRRELNPNAPLRLFGDKQIERLTTGQLQRWLDGRVTAAVGEGEHASDIDRRDVMRRAQASANRVWVILRAILNFAKSQGRVRSTEAWDSVKVFRNVDRPRTRVLTIEECRKLLAACPPDFARLARGALETGMRYGELAGLRVQDVVDGAVLIHDSKTGDARRVLLAKEGARFFKSLVRDRSDGAEPVFLQDNGRTWQSRKVDRPSTLACSRMDAACVKAGITRATFHDLRRTYGSLQYDRGQSLETLAKQWGHRDTRMAQRVYAHRQERTIRASIQQHLPSFEPTKRRAKVRK